MSLLVEGFLAKKAGIQVYKIIKFGFTLLNDYGVEKGQCVVSGGYSNLGARGKNFQKLMLSEKKKRSDLGLHIFLPKSKCSLKKKKGLHFNGVLQKKKKKGLHFDFISDFPIFLPKSRCSPKKKKSSLRFHL